MKKTNERLNFPKIKIKDKKKNRVIKNTTMSESITSQNGDIQKKKKHILINLSLTTKNIYKEGLNNAIHEYLLKNNLNETLKIFQKELLAKKKNIELENFKIKMKNEFKKGNKIIFFNYWCKYIPLSLRIHDKKTIITEFFMNIYFSIFKIHPFLKKKNNFSQKFSLKNFHKVIKDFKKYLVLQGDELTKIDELLPYFALPYMKEPHFHPLFKNLFSEKWIFEMEEKLEDFLKGLYDVEKEPLLVKVYKGFVKSMRNVDFKENLKNFDNKDIFKNGKYMKNEKIFKNDKKFDEKCSEDKKFLKNEGYFGNNKKKNFVINKKTKNDKREIFEYMKKLEDDNKKLTSIIEEFHKKSKNSEKKYEEKKKNEKIISIQIQKKWAIFTQQIINLTKNLFQFAKKFKKGKEQYLKKIKNKIKNFENFLQINKTDLNNNISICENEISIEDFKIVLFKYLNQEFIFLDFKKIKNDLLKNENSEKKQIILENLKEIFLNSTEYTIRTYAILLLEEDFFDFEKNKEIFEDDNKNKFILNNDYSKDDSEFQNKSKKIVLKNKSEKSEIINQKEKKSEKNLFKILSKNKKTQITFYEILNKLSLDYLFRGSLIKNSKIILNLIKILKSEKTDSNYRRIILALLQKISLRRKAQNLMLENNVMEMIFYILEKEKKDLCDFSKEYFLTLLMNLSLNFKGKVIFEKDSKFYYVNLLLEILENCTHSQRYFINGIIYSILLNEKIRKLALEKEIDKILMKNYEKLDLKFKKQIDFIKERLYKENDFSEKNKIEEFGDLDNLYSIENLKIKKYKNKPFVKKYQISNKKILKNLKLITNSYFTLFFKNTDEIINFDVTVDCEQPLQRPSTPSYFLKLSNNLEGSFNKYNYTEELPIKMNNSHFARNNQNGNFDFDSEEKNNENFVHDSDNKNGDGNFDFNSDKKIEDGNFDFNSEKKNEEIFEFSSEKKNKENFIDSEKKKNNGELNSDNENKENEKIVDINNFENSENKEFFDSNFVLEKNDDDFEKSEKKNIDNEFFKKNCSKSNTDLKINDNDNNIENNSSFVKNEKKIEWKQGFISKPLIERTPPLDNK